MNKFLELLKNKSDEGFTENGGRTFVTSGSDCLDLFFKAGAMRSADEERVRSAVTRAFAENPDKTMRIIFFARDVRGGLGERRFFRTAVKFLADHSPESVEKNIPLFSEYGRYDDLLALMGTACEKSAVAAIGKQLENDLQNMEKGEGVSLLGKWLPSVNTSSKETVATARRLCKGLDMSEKAYRKTLSALRRYIDITENRLRVRDYTFDYSKQPSGAMFKYRAAFSRNDRERYLAYLESVKKGKAKLNASALYPYEIVRAVLPSYWQKSALTNEERMSLDVTWNAMLAAGEETSENMNALAVVDGSGSMYWGCGSIRPIDAALSLGIYFAEKNKGAFGGHFITFSEHPRLVKIKGSDISEKVSYCASFNEAANTNLEAVFMLILSTALDNGMRSEEMPGRLYIISDMEFDSCITDGNKEPMFTTMEKLYNKHGYRLPEIVFWNVLSRSDNVPVKMSQTGAALVSGSSPAVFNMVRSENINPEKIMNDIIESERYKNIVA